MYANPPTIKMSLLLLITVSALHGQAAASKEPARTLHEIGNPSLVFAFLDFHEKIVRDIEAARKADLPMASELELGVIALYAEDKEAINTITLVQRVAQLKLSKLAGEEEEYIRPFMQRREQADVGRLSRFANGRFVILEAAIRELDKRLPQSALGKLIAYIDGTLRNQVKFVSNVIAQPGSEK